MIAGFGMKIQIAHAVSPTLDGNHEKKQAFSGGKLNIMDNVRVACAERTDISPRAEIPNVIG